MATALRALLSGIIDYAGLFPPAKLDMRTSIRNYAGYRESEMRWLLSRFVCPVARLLEFEEHAQSLWNGGPGPWRVTVLGRGGKDPESFVDGLKTDLETLVSFADRWEGKAVPDMLEILLPDGPTPISDLLGPLVQHPAPLPLRSVFVEIPPRKNWAEAVERISLDVAAWNQGGFDPPAGVKIRMGGQDPPPSPQEVSTFIVTARDAGLFFKATAGLHHPLRHHSSETDRPMHGFLNLFCGAVLAQSQGLGEAELCRVLGDERGEAFQFNQNRFSWNELSAGSLEIERARRDFAISIGSCSFTEPVEDLEGMGLL